MMWMDVHAELMAIAKARGELDLREARWLLVGEREEIHKHLGFGSFLEYCERVLGYRPKVAKERLRVAHKLVELPAMRAALEDGRLSYSAVRELSRKATAETDAELTMKAVGKTIREIEEMLRDGGAENRVLHVEVSPETYALWREARNAIIAETGESLDDDAVLATIFRRALGASSPASVPYQVSVTRCADCERAWQTGGGEHVEVPAAVVERAQCDAAEIGRVDGESPARATHTIPPSVRRMIWERFHGRCAVPGCRHAAFLEIHHIRHRADGGGDDPANLVLLCTAHHTLHHQGRLPIDGAYPALVFRHADGRPYGELPRPENVTDLRRALRGLGFDQRTTKNAIEVALSHVGRDAPLEQLVRAALQATKRAA